MFCTLCYMSYVLLILTLNYRLCSLLHSFLCMSLLLFFFFFFQAEDGIRDIGVTGVQTCALPISATIRLGSGSSPRGASGASRRSSRLCISSRSRRPCRSRWRHGSNSRGPRRDRKSGRVGKECRSRWSPYH